jgi:DNA (cytosine-5)-methyltransferase 1
LRFVDLFAGMGGFHRALDKLGHECVFVSEIDDELRELYAKNFRGVRKAIYGDIREFKGKVPPHDILCAGFPCQPFSKSGYQNGRRDRTRGTLFHEIIEILKRHQPQYVILENVGNFERHNKGRTWKVVRESLLELGYDVRGTTHVATGGHGLVSPHHFGYPHTRERFFIVAQLRKLPKDPFPPRELGLTTLGDIVQSQSELSYKDRQETSLTAQQVECIDHWNALLKRLPSQLPLPSFPIWGDEIDAVYPFSDKTPHATSLRVLRRLFRQNGHSRDWKKGDFLALLPNYARACEERFPSWKVAFIQQNRDWFAAIEPYLSPKWVSALRTFPPSLRKLEWNCKGEERDLWRHVLQFRPSGLRVKRYSSSPALVAMTTTQIPILGPKRRFLTRTEALRLQGFPDSHLLPMSRGDAFAALGNAVHVGLVKRIARSLFEQD